MKDLLTLKNILALVAAMIVAGCFVVVVAAAIQRFVPPSPHITCAVHYTFSEYATHSTEWQIRDGESCGDIHVQDEGV